LRPPLSTRLHMDHPYDAEAVNSPKRGEKNARASGICTCPPSARATGQ
jgi:hypothetical protein